jgi:hypothetical protein
MDAVKLLKKDSQLILNSNYLKDELYKFADKEILITGATGLSIPNSSNGGNTDVFIARLQNNDPKTFKPRGVLQSAVTSGNNVDVCFIDGQITTGFTNLTAGVDYFMDNNYQYTTGNIYKESMINNINK